MWQLDIGGGMELYYLSKTRDAIKSNAYGWGDRGIDESDVEVGSLHKRGFLYCMVRDVEEQIK